MARNTPHLSTVSTYFNQSLRSFGSIASHRSLGKRFLTRGMPAAPLVSSQIRQSADKTFNCNASETTLNPQPMLASLTRSMSG